MSHYLPHLQALGQREQEWDPDFMERRAEVLLRLAYMRLKDWLGLTWSESVDDRVYRHVEEPDDIDIDIDTDDVGSVG